MHLDHDPDRDRTTREQLDSSGLLRIAELDAHRDAVLDHFPDAVVGRVPDPSDPAGIFLRPPLRSGSRVGTPELLITLGGGYVPVLIRGHRTLDPGSGAWVSTLAAPTERAVSTRFRTRPHAADALALAHFHRLLGDLGLAADEAVGGVIGKGNPGGEFHITWHRLDVPGSSVLQDYDLRFADRYAVAVAAATRAAPLALPSRVGECRRCPWAAVCTAEMTAGRDVSLVAPGADGFLLKEAGVGTVDALANVEPEVLEQIPLTGIVAGTARLRARAWQHGASLVRRTEHPAVTRADIELDVDMESYMEDGAYLWGTYLTGTTAGSKLLRENGFDEGYRPFVTWEPLPTSDEGRAFAEFWAYLRSLRTLAHGRGLSFAAYCYSRAAEERWLRSTPARYPQVPGMPAAAEITEFITSDDWVDLYAVIGEEFVVPGSRKLKSVATVAGFSWRDPEPGGANSMVWYSGGVADPPDLGLRERVLRYNEDDVIATLELRRWITDRAAAETMSAAELEAAPPRWG
ncbi:TM0106 family RecB-like putative nuclease [Nakamurella silvestris]|nr:TM0106 family RecB-like putative nuclease [Nakamurella silvestris]